MRATILGIGTAAAKGGEDQGEPGGTDRWTTNSAPLVHVGMIFFLFACCALTRHQHDRRHIEHHERALVLTGEKDQGRGQAETRGSGAAPAALEAG